MRHKKSQEEVSRECKITSKWKTKDINPNLNVFYVTRQFFSLPHLCFMLIVHAHLCIYISEHIKNYRSPRVIDRGT